MKGREKLASRNGLRALQRHSETWKTCLNWCWTTFQTYLIIVIKTKMPLFKSSPFLCTEPRIYLKRSGAVLMPLL